MTFGPPSLQPSTVQRSPILLQDYAFLPWLPSLPGTPSPNVRGMPPLSHLSDLTFSDMPFSLWN